MPSIENAGAIVLAGGRSRRFEGSEKALATVGNRTLLARVVDVAGAVTDRTPIVAVATTEQRETYADVLDAPVRFVIDVPEREGPLAGLSSAVGASDARWSLVLGCDMPLVDEATIEWLAEKRTGETDVVVPRTADGLHPLHAWYQREAVANVLEADRSERSLHALVDRLSVVVVSAEGSPEDVDLERSVKNVNTRADLAAARTLFED
ncbi:molybdenum cofactor guanylyltransferase [Halorhabdus amylolytica]|uniref:molybdenum cofactor guanylyltransferase n=1 Tax=Halorhabdus amylolytica TaxID=2559573 RepID=UPI0010AAF37A|nr:molybdenum cofactor guanylyltransferase [Halorhabdus amylolytica]